jgi:futalosine hydrolase
MEGAAVAQVAAALHVPLYQVRGVSNLVGDRDKSNWRVADAVTASCAAARGAARLLPEVE